VPPPAGSTRRCDTSFGAKDRDDLEDLDSRIALDAVGLGDRRGEIRLVVKYKTGLSDTEAAKTIAQRAPQYEALPGLQQKLYIREPGTGEYGGIYLWEDEDSMREFREIRSFNPEKSYDTGPIADSAVPLGEQANQQHGLVVVPYYSPITLITSRFGLRPSNSV
jgi:hypothetical protein